MQQHYLHRSLLEFMFYAGNIFESLQIILHNIIDIFENQLINIIKFTHKYTLFEKRHGAIVTDEKYR